MYIGIISDTHGDFDQKIKEFLEPVDEIWHAGDFGTVAVADEIAAFKPLRGVHGNCDGLDIRVTYHECEAFEVEGKRVLIKHIGGYPGRYDWNAVNFINHFKPDIFVCGHSHILKVINDPKYNMLCINPGASGLLGFHKVKTAIRFHIDDGVIHDMEVGEWRKF
jgi:putative phosphoesterase